MESLGKELIKWLKEWEECSDCNHMVRNPYWDNNNNIICTDCMEVRDEINFKLKEK